MSSSIDVISFLRTFKEQQKFSVQDQIPLLLFPRLIDLGFSFINSASLLYEEGSARTHLLNMMQFQEPIVQDFLLLTSKNGITIRREAFNNSLNEMNLFCNGMIKNFMVDFSNSFGSGYHLSNSFDGSIESLQEDERNALLTYFRNLGVSIIFHSFLFLSENYETNDQFQTTIRQYTRNLALSFVPKTKTEV